MNNGFSPSRRAWNRVMTVLVWASAVLVMILVAGIIGMVLVRGIPHISWNFLSTTASVLKRRTHSARHPQHLVCHCADITDRTASGRGRGGLPDRIRLQPAAHRGHRVHQRNAGRYPQHHLRLGGYAGVQSGAGLPDLSAVRQSDAGGDEPATIIRTTQESLKTVPQGYREGAMGLGAGKWHIIRTIVLPCSIDGIVTGCILAVGRIVGESAALLFTAGAAEVIAKSVFKAYTSNGATLSVLLYLRAFEDGDFTSAWGIGAVLLVLVLLINLAARLAKTKLKQKQ